MEGRASNGGQGQLRAGIMVWREVMIAWARTVAVGMVEESSHRVSHSFFHSTFIALLLSAGVLRIQQ